MIISAEAVAAAAVVPASTNIINSTNNIHLTLSPIVSIFVDATYKTIAQRNNKLIFDEFIGVGACYICHHCQWTNCFDSGVRFVPDGSTNQCDVDNATATISRAMVCLEVEVDFSSSGRRRRTAMLMSSLLVPLLQRQQQ